MTEWKIYRLGELVRVKGGKRLPKGISLQTTPNTHPYIRIRDMGKSRVLELDATYEYVDDVTQKSIARYVVDEGDILLSIVGTIGLVGIVGKSLHQANQTENCVKLVNLNGIDPLFLYYYLLSPNGQDEIKRGTVGAVQAKLPIKNIENINISLPGLEEQRRIAGILSAIDDKIENNRRINTNLELQAQALYKQWFVDFEFPNEDGKPYKSSGGKMVDSDLGPIPDGWNNIRFSKFCHLSNDRVGGLCVSDYSITNNGITPRGQKYTKQLSQNRAENKLLRKGNLAFGMSRDILNWGIMKDEIGAVSPAYTVYTIGDIDATYLELYIQSHIAYFRDLIKPAAREGQSIDKGVLNNKMLYYPPKHLLRAFLAIFNSISNNFCIKENETLATLRDTLLPKLMNGEIKL